jgi:hypothetical protein
MRDLRGWFLLVAATGVTVSVAGLLAVSGATDVDSSTSAMRPMIERYLTDKATLERSWSEVSEFGPGARGRSGGVEPMTPGQVARMRRFYSEWVDALLAVPFDSFDHTSKVDYLLLDNRLRYEVSRLDAIDRRLAAIRPVVAFGDAVLDLDLTRRKMEPVKPEAAARGLNQMIKDLAAVRRSLDGGRTAPGEGGGHARPGLAPMTRDVAGAAATYVVRLRAVLKNWFSFYNGYDPHFTWWVAQTYKDADQALEGHAAYLQQRAGAGASPETLGIAMVAPIGREALLVELQREMIPYSPEELVAIANAEFAWCDREMLKASREMGFGDDWHAALEKVKTMHVEPGQQPDLVRKLVLEGIDFVEQHDLVTVPPMVKEIWRMQMLSPQRQLISPFFLGGETIMVSFPTDTMTFEQKMMSMRGNNIPFSHAVAFHEEIPGHLLQAFMTERYRTYRAAFDTPFWTEGNALWWEMLFWDLGYPKTPEERIGMLFWRMHRCARIIFSLSYHLGTMTPQQAVDFLVTRVGHEPDTAAGEVRRSFDGSYPPLYQCAYMLGALQFRALHRELVDSKTMTNRAFHDAILKENRIPIELIRADLTNQKLTRDFKTTWRFYGDPPSSSPAKTPVGVSSRH